MSVTTVSQNSSSSVGNKILQQLAGQGKSSTAGSTSALADLLSDTASISSASRQLSDAPAAVVQALDDLLAGQKDVQGDLAQLKDYFQQNPGKLADVLGSLEEDSGTYGSSGTWNSRSALLSALFNGQTGTANPSLFGTLLGSSESDSGDMFTALA
ncbi:MAG TPA: hypothetical protein VN436_08995 [Holophaga sp.]|nr:hypothetical protein [Holophaga sp.]